MHGCRTSGNGAVGASKPPTMALQPTGGIVAFLTSSVCGSLYRFRTLYSSAGG